MNMAQRERQGSREWHALRQKRLPEAQMIGSARRNGPQQASPALVCAR
ncbi:MAG: hypothetical protein KIT25_16945 [Enhydrobacter sp.]|nr:MAG: hypothetical protein KIT25_16945 [Enhydrobacter sp.]